MEIVVNENNEILNYATVGSIEGSIFIEDVLIPNDFEFVFLPKLFMYVGGEIKLNQDFRREEDNVKPKEKQKDELIAEMKRFKEMYEEILSIDESSEKDMIE